MKGSLRHLLLAFITAAIVAIVACTPEPTVEVRYLPAPTTVIDELCQEMLELARERKGLLRSPQLALVQECIRHNGRVD